MTDQPMTEKTLSADEFYAETGAHYGMIVGRLITANLELNKLLVTEKNHTARLKANQAELERQNSQLVAGAITYEQRIAELEAENARLRRGEFTANEIAAQGTAIVNEARIKKAAPVGG
jgi:hypothetical protein